MYSEQKWKTSEEKVAFAKSFPGLLKSKDQTKMIVKVVALSHATLFVYSDSTFYFEPLFFEDVPKFMKSLRESESHLDSMHQENFEKLALLSSRDSEIGRLSKMEKLLSAIVNNSSDIPELFSFIPDLLRDIELEIDFHIARFVFDSEKQNRVKRVLNAIKTNIRETPELYVELPKVLNGTSSIIECSVMKSRLQRIQSQQQQ